MKHTICYLSKESEALKNADLENLFQFIVSRNTSLDISGALLHNEGFFLQVLEGLESTISNIFEKIKKDRRHRNILTILDQSIENRIFDNYEATFNILKTKEDIKRLNTYLSKYDFQKKYPNNIQTLIEPFLL